MKKNIFLTGPPSSGKTTVIKKVIKKLGIPANGFYTEEERADGKRLGFLMKTLDGFEFYGITGFDFDWCASLRISWINSPWARNPEK